VTTTRPDGDRLERVTIVRTPSPARRDVIRVTVDLGRCVGYAQCCFQAPAVFELEGTQALRYEPDPDPAERRRVRRAAAACPAQAIVVDDPLER
jgi:ferredoxin